MPPPARAGPGRRDGPTLSLLRKLTLLVVVAARSLSNRTLGHHLFAQIHLLHSSAGPGAAAPAPRRSGAQGPGQARGAEALLSARGARREARIGTSANPACAHRHVLPVGPSYPSTFVRSDLCAHRPVLRPSQRAVAPDSGTGGGPPWPAPGSTLWARAPARGPDRCACARSRIPRRISRAGPSKDTGTHPKPTSRHVRWVVQKFPPTNPRRISRRESRGDLAPKHRAPRSSESASPAVRLAGCGRRAPIAASDEGEGGSVCRGKSPTVRESRNVAAPHGPRSSAHQDGHERRRSGCFPRYSRHRCAERVRRLAAGLLQPARPGGRPSRCRSQAGVSSFREGGARAERALPARPDRAAADHARGAGRLAGRGGLPVSAQRSARQHRS